MEAKAQRVAGMMAPWKRKSTSPPARKPSQGHWFFYGGCGIDARANVLRLEWPTIAARFRQRLLRPDKTAARLSLQEGRAHG